MSRSVLDRYLKKTRPIQAKSYLWKNDDDYVPLQKYDDHYESTMMIKEVRRWLVMYDESESW